MALTSDYRCPGTVGFSRAVRPEQHLSLYLCASCWPAAGVAGAGARSVAQHRGPGVGHDRPPARRVLRPARLRPRSSCGRLPLQGDLKQGAGVRVFIGWK